MTRKSEPDHVVLSPFFRHFGSKQRLVKLARPPNRDVIIEPFAGGAGYSCRYGAGKRVELYDVDKDVVMIWDYLLGASQEQVLKIPVNFGMVDIRKLAVSKPEMLLIRKWLNLHGLGRWRAPPLALRSGSNSLTFWGETIRGRIAEQLPFIANWSISRRSYHDIDIDREATWHVDPPYQRNRHSTQAYDYLPINYSFLASWCQSLRGQVMVHEQIGADWLPFEALDPVAHTSATKPDGTKKTQCEMWYHRDDPVTATEPGQKPEEDKQ